MDAVCNLLLRESVPIGPRYSLRGPGVDWFEIGTAL